jgi:hypothetical protein
VRIEKPIIDATNKVSMQVVVVFVILSQRRLEISIAELS